MILCTAAVGYAGFALAPALAFDARRVEPSIYKIYTLIPEPGGQYSVSSGTGFLVSGRRLVVTNFHVLEGSQRIYIAFLEGEEAKLVEAARKQSHPGLDLVLLEAREDLPGTPLKLGEYEPDKLSEVIAIGFPGAANLNKEFVPGTDARGVPVTDLESTVTTGIVSRMTSTNLKVGHGQVLTARAVQHNSAINPGNSGGPLLDACGLVVGVNTLQGIDAQGVFFSIHASELGRFLREAKVSYASTARPCAGAHASGVPPWVVGLAAALALCALAVGWRPERALALIGAVPRAVSGLWAPKVTRARVGPGPAANESRAAPQPTAVLSLRPVNGGVPVRLEGANGTGTLGRGPGVDIVIPNETVSKVHARLAWAADTGRIRITDLGSSNGTYLDGIRITEAEAGPSARIAFGTAAYTVAAETRGDADAWSGWMLSGFDPSGRALQFELRPPLDAAGRTRTVTWVVGRDPRKADLVIEDPSVSSLHAELVYTPGLPLQVRDMGSRNGTRLDGESTGTRKVALEGTGQELAFGLARLRLSHLGG